MLTDELLVVINHDESVKWRDYSHRDFKEVYCLSVEDLTSSYKNKKVDDDFVRILRLKLPNKKSVKLKEAINIISDRSDVTSAEPNYLFYNDNMNHKLINSKILNKNSKSNTEINNWGLELTMAYEAYDIIELLDLQNINVEVLDSDVDYLHEDLIGQVNMDLYAIFDNFPNYSDSFQHGTRVSAIIAANRNNVGIDGFFPFAKIVNLEWKAYNTVSYATQMSQLVSAIVYADNINLRVLNCSFGYQQYSYAVYYAINNYDGIAVCGAGNSFSDLDDYPFYPACYNCDNIICVGGVNQNGEIWNDYDGFGSSYGMSCDVMAPAVDIWLPDYRLDNNHYYTCDSGTSYATAYVSALVAMIISLEEPLNEEFSNSEIKSFILDNVTLVSSLSQYCNSSGYINALFTIADVLGIELQDEYSYYNETYHLVNPIYGDSYLEEHNWILFPPNNKANTKLPPFFVYQCTKCGANRFM